MINELPAVYAKRNIEVLVMLWTRIRPMPWKAEEPSRYAPRIVSENSELLKVINHRLQKLDNDLAHRSVVQKGGGWAMSERIDQRLVIDALNMALVQSKPEAGLIHHTDQRRQYSATAFVAMLERHGMIQSMSRRRGNCDHNAVAESFFSALKNEIVHHSRFKSRDEARTTIFEYIELFYNRQRRRQSLDFFSPVECERSKAVA